MESERSWVSHTRRQTFPLVFILSSPMCVVYILKSLKDERYYVGSTINLDRRLRQHNAGQQAVTRYRRPLPLVNIEKCPDEAAARRREHEIKKQKSRRYLETLVDGGMGILKDPGD